jgi:uncharacterized membrane protein
LRIHIQALSLQALLAGIAAMAFGWLALAAMSPNPLGRRVALLIAVAAIVGSALIFTKHGLTAFAAYEN